MPVAVQIHVAYDKSLKKKKKTKKKTKKKQQKNKTKQNNTYWVIPVCQRSKE